MEFNFSTGKKSLPVKLVNYRKGIRKTRKQNVIERKLHNAEQFINNLEPLALPNATLKTKRGLDSVVKITQFDHKSSRKAVKIYSLIRLRSYLLGNEHVT